MSNNSLEQYWTEVNDNNVFWRPPADHYIRKKIIQYVPHASHGEDAIEIGAYPGTFLSVFGDLGYTLHGIDLYARITDLKYILQQEGYRVGEFLSADFLGWQTSQSFHVVSSFGFFEHFTDYASVIRKHVLLAKPGGYIVLGAPNFAHGLQYWFHRLFDKPNLRRHVLESMDPGKIAALLQNENTEILYSGYCGGVNFWMNSDQSRFARLMGRVFLKSLSITKKIFFWVKFDDINSKNVSSYLMVICRKKST